MTHSEPKKIMRVHDLRYPFDFGSIGLTERLESFNVSIVDLEGDSCGACLKYLVDSLPNPQERVDAVHQLYFNGGRLEDQFFHQALQIDPTLDVFLSFGSGGGLEPYDELSEPLMD